MLATGVLLGLLREHFGNPQAITEPLLKHYVWRSDDDTAIMIETCTNDVLTRLQMRPAILVRRDVIQIKREGLDDEIKSFSPSTGNSYVVTLHGSHTIFCIAGKPNHAEMLANETAIYLLQFAPCIRGNLCFRGDFKLEQIGELATIQGVGGQYVVPVTFSYVTDFAWTIAPDVPVLRHINFKLLLNS